MMEAIPWKKTWIDPIVCLAPRSPGLKRRKDSGRDRWVGPRQQQAPSRQRESREQWGTWWIWSFSKMSHAYSIYVQLYMHKVQCIYRKLYHLVGSQQIFRECYLAWENFTDKVICLQLTGSKQGEGWQMYFLARPWTRKRGGDCRRISDEKWTKNIVLCLNRSRRVTR